MKLSKRKTFYLIATLIVDGIFFGLTNPSSVKAIWLVVAYALAVVTSYFLVSGLASLLQWYGVRLAHRRRFIGLMTALVAVLLALSSTGQLSLKEVLIIIPFVSIVYFYLSRSRQPS